MAIEIDQHCGFHREEEHYHARHAFFGLQFIRATTYAFRASYRGRVLSWRQGVPASDLEAMRRRQAQIPVLMMAAGKRAWWWFQDQFHSLTEPYDDPLVIKGLILEWRQRRARKAARAAATASGRTAPRPPKKPRRRAPETASSSPPPPPPRPAASAAKAVPWQVLEVERSASAEVIKKAYLRQISLYHPDKVAHLGPDLQRLAEEKTRQINQAYEALRRGA